MTFQTLTDLDAWFRKEILGAMQRQENYDVLLDIAKQYKTYYNKLGGVNNG